MLDKREPGSVIAAAEQAAATGDYVSAERLLREALQLQETGLGPHHPDLANTLNNLGVVCDLADKPDEAERCYRRAYAIAAGSLAPDHPFVATSRKNLEGFCAVRGRPVDVPRPSLPVRVPAAARRLSRPLAIGAVSVCAVAVLTIVIAARKRPHVEPLLSSPATAARSGAVAEVPQVRATPATATAAPIAADVQLCRALSTGAPVWHCDQAGSVVNPGPLFFYTRLQSARDTRVLHRWYRGDRLQQQMELEVRASPENGYRVYSRKTVTADRSGDWRVELRTADGRLLHEERFTVR